MGNRIGGKNPKPLPIDTTFKLPSPAPSWPPGEGFASGTIDLGGLQVCQISTFTKIWATYEGGNGNQGATIFEPSSIPDGFSMLGSYCQANNNPLFGWILVAKDVSNGTLSKPIDYTLVWSSESLQINQSGSGYIWLPIPQDGYKSVGHVITDSPGKPPLEKIRCVRADFTEDCDIGKWIWGKGTKSDVNEFNVYGLKPKYIWSKGQGVCVGTFIAQNKGDTSLSLSCLKNNNFYASLAPMPNLPQVEAIIQAYSPLLYFHPKETYLPSSVNWFFTKGVQLHQKSHDDSKPNPINVEPTGSNLPQGGSNDGEYWLDLPNDKKTSEEVKKGNLSSVETYLHIKPIYGATFTDIQIWTFYPFNGPVTAKVGLVDIPLRRTGEHVGDWEHVTLRISNFDGVLYSVYFAQHSGGIWIDSPLLEFTNGSNKFVTYSSLHGHATYPSAGLEMQGTDALGIRNDRAKSDKFIDTGAKYLIVAGEYLGIIEPAWLNYARKWGPKKTYEIGEGVELLENSVLEGLAKLIPDEVSGEDGPTGPKAKNEWDWDER